MAGEAAIQQLLQVAYYAWACLAAFSFVYILYGVALRSCCAPVIACCTISQRRPAAANSDSVDRALVFRWLVVLVTWGVVHFGFVPLAFVAARCNLLPALWAMMAAQSAAGTCIMLYFRRSMDDFTSRLSQQRYQGLQMHWDQQWAVPCLGLTICLSRQYVSVLLALAELSDPTSDAGNAGRAGWVMTDDANEQFAHSWHSVRLPGFFDDLAVAFATALGENASSTGDLIANMGLPRVLAALVVLATCVQMISASGRVVRIWAHINAISSWPTPPLDSDTEPADPTDDGELHRYELWGSMSMLADALGLRLVAEMFARLRNHHHGDRRDKAYASNLAAYRFEEVKAVEALPSMWFGVTLLALSYETSSPAGLATNLFSTCTTFATMAMSSVDLVQELRAIVADPDIRLPKRLAWTGRTAFALVTIGFFMLSSSARLIGVWTCSSHILNTLPFHCVTVDTES
mmetsp:Transcript_51025/g.131543  ORF Transcript_51025/g.131543 Transcript_51025/m.131543 type:complete len:461 (-) Transcript_51025:65-1447(-)